MGSKSFFQTPFLPEELPLNEIRAILLIFLMLPKPATTYEFREVHKNELSRV